MVEYPKAKDLQGAVLVGLWGKTPVYDVPNMHSLNQLVGYVKHINAGNGTVLYRGQCKLYEHVVPSIKHDLSHELENRARLENTISDMIADGPLNSFFGFKQSDIEGWQLYQKLVVEAALQHYGAKTYCVDFVDNHWTALWFGLYEFDSKNTQYQIRKNTNRGETYPYLIKSKDMQKRSCPNKPTRSTVTLSKEKYAELETHAKKATVSYDELVRRNVDKKYQRELNNWDKLCKSVQEYNKHIDFIEKNDHLFLFLYVSETNYSNIHGVYIGEKTYTIDLRKALPSTFLRPCSQHGWIVRGKQPDYDFNKNIACVVRVNIDLASKMLGTGELLSQDNFFPNEKTDQGYNILLERQVGSRIALKKASGYKEILPQNMIMDFG